VHLRSQACYHTRRRILRGGSDGGDALGHIARWPLGSTPGQCGGSFHETQRHGLTAAAPSTELKFKLLAARWALLDQARATDRGSPLFTREPRAGGDRRPSLTPLRRCRLALNAAFSVDAALFGANTIDY
jgi:hypothetical protein